MTTTCKSLQTLLSEPLTWMLTPHGDGWALGWRGPAEYRELAYNLFANYFQPSGFTSPQHVLIDDSCSYVYLPNPDAIKPTLALFFHVNIIRDGEVKTTKEWVPCMETEDSEEIDNGDYVFWADEEAAAILAAECADAFMATIKPMGFIPAPPKPHADVYSMGRFLKEELTLVEDYASWASA